MGMVRHPPRVVEGSSQEHFDVGVEAPELIGRPAGERVVHGWIKAQRHLLAVPAHV
jgi:hypothetical protein